MNDDLTQLFGGTKVVRAAVRNCLFELTGSNGEPLLGLKFRVDDSSMRVVVEGEDRPGTLLLVTSLFSRYGVNVVACHGRRLFFTQGVEFELEYSPENCERVSRMLGEAQNHFVGAELLPPTVSDRVVSVRVDVPMDAPGLLTPLARVMAERGVNLHAFNAQKRLLGKRFGRPEVTVEAEMELPVGLDLDDLKAELKAACPPGSKLKFREEYTADGDDDAVEAGVLVGV